MIGYNLAYNVILGGIMYQEQEDLRNKLSAIISNGLSASAIAKATNITTIDISRFKNGQICLIEPVADRLKTYLDRVVIPD